MTRSRPRRRTAAACLAALAAALVLSATAAATLPIGDQSRVSQMGTDGNTTFSGLYASVAHNARANQYLVAWEGSTTVGGEHEIWGRLLNADGAPASAQFRVSDMGPPGNTAYGATWPHVAYNGRANEYLVVWQADDDTGLLVQGETEIYGQRISAAGDEIGADDFRISDMGPDGTTSFEARTPRVAYNATTNEYLVVWESDDDTLPLVDGEIEVFGQRLDASGNEIGENDVRLSDMGPDGNADFDANVPQVAVNSLTGEFLVVWSGEEANDEIEVYGQRLSPTGAEIGTSDFRISDMGPDGSTAFLAIAGGVAYNARTNEFLVTWVGDDDTAPLVDNEFEVFGQRLDAAGSQVGANDVRISDMGVNGSTNSGVVESYTPVAASYRAGEYLVAWHGDDEDAAPLGTSDFEVFGQRVDGAGAEVGTNDFRISAMGPDGDPAYRALLPASAYNARDNEYLVAWYGDTNVSPLVNDELEIWARRTGAGALFEPPAPVCGAVTAPVAPPGDPSKVTLSATQLLINQRISQAAVRRVNAVQEWLDAGLRAGDLCGGALLPADFGVGVTTGYLSPDVAPSLPAPRAVTALPIGGGDPSKVRLTRAQLLVNQRISQAAVRRSYALAARLATGLTGGDIVDGQVTRERLELGLGILAASPLASPPAASKTVVAPPTRGDPAKVTLTRTQLLINQRISQAAVKRSNTLRARLLSGLTGAEIADGTVTAVDLAAGVTP